MDKKFYKTSNTFAFKDDILSVTKGTTHGRRWKSHESDRRSRDTIEFRKEPKRPNQNRVVVVIQTITKWSVARQRNNPSMLGPNRTTKSKGASFTDGSIDLYEQIPSEFD